MASATTSPTVVLGRLLRSPGGDPGAADSRLELLGRLLRRGGGWWTAEELCEAGEDQDELRERLKELRKIGVLSWDHDIGGYALVEELRVPLSLTLMACSGPPQQDQLVALDRLLPFAQISTRGDEVAAPAWAMLDLLSRDLRLLRAARAAGPDRLQEVARERWLIRSADSMNEVLDHLRDFAAEHPAAEALVEEAVDLLSEAGELIAGLSLRMSRSARDNLRLSGTIRSGAELRAAISGLSPDQLAESMSLACGLAPEVVSIPSPEQLAVAYPQLGEDRARSYPEPRVAELPSEPPRTDAREMARTRLRSPRVFTPSDRWAEAVRVHQGLVRLQGEGARSGQSPWRSVPERETVGGEISWAWKIISN